MLEGYGPHKGMTPGKANYLLDGVPVFHALTEGTFGTSRNRTVSSENERKAKALAEQVKAIEIAERPGFIHVWTVGWDFGPTSLRMAADLLPPEYVVVRPDELSALFKKYRPDAEISDDQPSLTPSGTVAESAADHGLIIDTGKAKFEIAWGDEPQPPIKRVMGADGKWRGSGMLYAYNPKELAVESFTASKVKDDPGEKEYLLTYSYGPRGRMTLKVRAVAGKPYLLIEDECRGADLPSWAFSPYTDFEPDVLLTDAGVRPLDYRSAKSMGALPWYRWALATKQTDRDVVGIFTVSWSDWTGSEALFWQQAPGGYFEFYCSRTGVRRYALAALDRTDPASPSTTWAELNGR
jgi:hypothetical protein